MSFIDFAGSTVHSVGGRASLAGLVGITAPCANVTPGSAVVIGPNSGAPVVFPVLFFDTLKIDGPVGAIIGLRVSAEEEIESLDAFEHGNDAYAPDTFSSSAAGQTA